MPIISVDNDNNLVRMCAKMSESFSGFKSNSQLSNSTDDLNYFRDTNNSDNRNNLNLTCDHMYESSDTNGDVDLNPTCQSAESEVKFLKDWLLLHLDLIQQQNDEILSKENTILILQKENEMLKERLHSMEQGSPYQDTKYFDCHTPPSCQLEDMTQDSTPCEEDNKDHIQLLDLNCENATHSADPPATQNQPQLNIFTDNTKNDGENEEGKVITENKKESPVEKFDVDNSVLSLTNSNYAVHNLDSGDPGKTLKMSIRRKRVCSSSSAVSNNGSAAEDKRRKSRKKRKKTIKDEHILNCDEQYVTQTGEVAYGLINEQETAMEIAAAAADSANLEVPRWRVKVYTSCYTMEGTENLDDEVYNKRHIRLENDERRRKRWDVQRIREQRIIEKLKQRQERVGSGSRNGENTEPVQSLWPTVDDIRYLEVCDNLPVSVYGCPVVRFTPSEFTIPWMNNPNRSLRKVPIRKSTVKRKATKR